MAAEHRRSRPGAIRQIGLERLNQPTLVLSRQVVFDSRRSRPGMDSCLASLLGLLQVEDRAKGKGLPHQRGKGDKFDLRLAGGAGHRAIGGAEVNANCWDLVLRLLHPLHYFSRAPLDIDREARPCCWHEENA